MRLTIRGSPGETLWLTLDGALLERFALESIQPEPTQAEAPAAACACSSSSAATAPRST